MKLRNLLIAVSLAISFVCTAPAFAGTPVDDAAAVYQAQALPDVHTDAGVIDNVLTIAAAPMLAVETIEKPAAEVPATPGEVHAFARRLSKSKPAIVDTGGS